MPCLTDHCKRSITIHYQHSWHFCVFKCFLDLFEIINNFSTYNIAFMWRDTPYETFLFVLYLRIVADNVDFTIQSRHQRKSSQNKSLHWTHAFAVKNRVSPDSSLCYNKPQMKVTDLEMYHILPSKDDQKEICNDLVPLVYRELVEYLPCYAPFKCGLQHHIPHPHSKEMRRKSEQVWLKTKKGECGF